MLTPVKVVAGAEDGRDLIDCPAASFQSTGARLTSANVIPETVKSKTMAATCDARESIGEGNQGTSVGRPKEYTAPSAFP